MQELESRAEDMVLDAEQKIGTRDAEARSRQAPLWASISGQYYSRFNAVLKTDNFGIIE